MSRRTKTETGRRPSEANSEDGMLITVTATWRLTDLWGISRTFEGLSQHFYDLSEEIPPEAFVLIETFFFVLLFSEFLDHFLHMTEVLQHTCLLSNKNTMKSCPSAPITDLLLLYWLPLLAESEEQMAHDRKTTRKTYGRQICIQKLCVIIV